MGACNFVSIASGATAEEAFIAAVREAEYEHGHGGYTGTIAEKDSLVMIQKQPLEGKAALELADALINRFDPRIDDKWGPAGCIPLTDGSFLFFGWASS